MVTDFAAGRDGGSGVGRVVKEDHHLKEKILFTLVRLVVVVDQLEAVLLAGDHVLREEVKLAVFVNVDGD